MGDLWDCVSFATGSWLFSGQLLHPETLEYDWMAQSLLAGHGLVFPHLQIPYHSFAPPLYPWLSAASYWLCGSLIILMMLQVVAGSALAVVGAQIARRFSAGAIAPLAAGLLIAFHPGLIIYNVNKAHPLTFDALFFTLAVLQAFRLRERMIVRRAIELGVIVGLGTLSRATLIIFFAAGSHVVDLGLAKGLAQTCRAGNCGCRPVHDCDRDSVDHPHLTPSS